MDIPVFLFTGFLESGKSSFIQDTVEDPNFTENQKVLVIVCEEGEVEYDVTKLAAANVAVEYIENEEDYTLEKLNELAKAYNPKKVIVEWNGMWRVEKLLTTAYPRKWQIVQMITTVAAGTFEVYLQNMRSLIMEQFTNSDMVVFNRCDANTNIGLCRRSVKAVNPAAQVYFENADGSEPNKDDQLPFDVKGDVIELEEEDYGVWFVDCMDDPAKYNGKTLITNAQVYKNIKFPTGTFVPGRYAMTCCADDVRFIGPLCKSSIGTDAIVKTLKKGDNIRIKAKIVMEENNFYKGVGPVLYAEEITPAKAPKNEYVYFN
ncbi:MAG: GTPase [Lachnospira sp.]|nr:GTPase [Lachnospira sp.]